MVIWIIGLSGSGKTTLAKNVYSNVQKKTPNVVLLDGDIVREIFSDNPGYTPEGRKKNSDRIRALCSLLDDQGIHVICAILSIFHEAQEWNRRNYSGYYEVFLDVPFNQLTERDKKGLYKGAKNKEVKNVVGVDIEFKPPKNPDLVIENTGTLDDLLSRAPEIAQKITGK